MAVSAQRRRRALVAVVAALIAAGAFYLAIEYTSKPSSTPPSGSGQQAQTSAAPTESVVVVSVAVTPGAKVSASNIAMVSVPESALPRAGTGGTPSYYSSSNSVSQLSAANEYFAVGLSAGTVLQPTMLSTTQTQSGSQFSVIPATLQKGDVAVAVPVSNSVTGAGGYPVAGEQIDVLVDIWAPTGTPVLIGTGTFSNVRVIEVGPAGGSTGSTGSTLFLVELPLAQAHDLTALANSKNVTFTYVLAAHGDYTGSASDTTETITLVPNSGYSSWQSATGGA